MMTTVEGIFREEKGECTRPNHNEYFFSVSSCDLCNNSANKRQNWLPDLEAKCNDILALQAETNDATGKLSRASRIRRSIHAPVEVRMEMIADTMLQLRCEKLSEGTDHLRQFTHFNQRTHQRRWCDWRPPGRDQ